MMIPSPGHVGQCFTMGSHSDFCNASKGWDRHQKKTDPTDWPFTKTGMDGRRDS